MKISDIRVRLVKSDTSKIRGSVSITIDDNIVVHDIKVIENTEDGTYFISMPNRKGSDGKFKDIVHPANTETREMLKGLVLDAFKAELAKA